MSEHLRLRGAVAAVVTAVLALVLSACSSSSNGHGGGSPVAGTAAGSSSPNGIGLSASVPVSGPSAASSTNHHTTAPSGGSTSTRTGGGGGSTSRNPGHVTVHVAGPASYRGWCPIALSYTATITVQHVPADITYHWDDGTASAGAAIQHVTHSPARISRTIHPSTDTSGSIGLDVISPVTASSNTARFTIACQTVSAHASNNTSAYTGSCAHAITFITTGTVSVTNGPFVVQYRWVRSDGAMTSPQPLSFGPGTDTQSVTLSWTFTPPGNETMWQRLEILGDHGVTSNQATFTITCA